jgi:erythromycin esterase-like protein
MKRSGPFRFALRVMLAFAAGPALAQSVAPRAAVPVDPIGRVLEAFQAHPVVALGEGGHGNEQTHRFRLALIRDPRFAATVNDIVVESGSARYQAVMDRFVSGENVPYDLLEHVWQDTTQPTEVDR